MCSKIISVLFLFLFTLVVSDSEFSTIYKEYVNAEELTTQIKAYLGDDNEAAMVALKMADAWTKFPSGVLEGNWIDLGSFDECYGINYKEIYGKYCLGIYQFKNDTKQIFNFFNKTVKPRTTIFLHPQPRLIGLGADYVGLHFAACVPSNMPAAAIPGLFDYTEDFCYSKDTEPSLSAGGITTITIISLFLGIAVISTIYDICLYYLKKEAHHELLIAFSFFHNGRKLFRFGKNSDQLSCLNGIRALSMMWVILGHEYSNAMNGPLSNFFYLNEWQTDSANMFLIGATVSVDTFFVVGGLVTVYAFMKSMDKGVKFNVLLFYIHRYLRLTPAFFIMGLIHLFLLNHFGNGPLWKVVDISLVETCRTGWWSSLLYITNYVHKGICLPQAWYLSVDMQLFVLSPIVLIVLSKWSKIGLGMLGLLIVAGCVTPFVISWVNHMPASMTSLTNSEDYMNLYYTQTYARFGPYVIGLFVGYFIYKLKKGQIKVQLKWWMVVSLWLIFVTGLVACVYSIYPLGQADPEKEDRWGNAMFMAFDRPAWAVAVSGVIFLCVAGYGGPIDKFLSLPIFQFLTKLSYSMYLVHFSVITIRYASMKNSVKFSNLSMMHVFWGDFMLTLALSLVLCLTFESPIIILEKYLFHSGSSEKKRISKK